MKAGELQRVKQKNALLGYSYLSRDGEGAHSNTRWRTVETNFLYKETILRPF